MRKLCGLAAVIVLCGTASAASPGNGLIAYVAGDGIDVASRTVAARRDGSPQDSGGG